MAIWLIRAGSHGEYEQKFIQENRVYVTWDDLDLLGCWIGGAEAAREHRSIANMVEVLIRDYCGRNGIAIPEQDDLFDNGPKPAKGRK